MVLIFLVVCPLLFHSMLMIQSSIDQSILFRMKVNLQTELDAIRTWSTINKLPLNVAKCVVMHITRSHSPIFVSYHVGDTRLETISIHKHLGIVFSSNLEWAPMLTRSPARLNVCLDLFGGLLVFMILSPWRNCLLLLLDQSLSIVHHFGLQTGNVTNIRWKRFRGVLLAIVFPVLGTQDHLTIPGSELSIFPPLFPVLITFVACLL